MGDNQNLNDSLDLLRNIFLLSHIVSEKYNINQTEIFTYLKLEIGYKNIGKPLAYPDKKIKLEDLKKILKNLDLPIKGNKKDLYECLCDVIDRINEFV